MLIILFDQERVKGKLIPMLNLGDSRKLQTNNRHLSLLDCVSLNSITYTASIKTYIGAGLNRFTPMLDLVDLPP